MTAEALRARLREVVAQPLPLPGGGDTAGRHRALVEIGREDLTLAKLAEAHWDAVAILAEAGLEPVSGELYAVWASEIPGRALTLASETVSGTKAFCSGSDLVDRALVTAGPDGSQLVEIDLRQAAQTISIDLAGWKTDAFRETHTGAMTFAATPVVKLVGTAGWYSGRAGFWHGACGPAACWAGGVAGLLDVAHASRREDPHTMAHLGAIRANVWAMMAVLERAGEEIDRAAEDVGGARRRALMVRHLVEQMGTDILRRFARAYGPAPLAMQEEVARRYHEADLYLRQCHGERDLEELGRLLAQAPVSSGLRAK
jgi:hypothetical protein